MSQYPLKNLKEIGFCGKTSCVYDLYYEPCSGLALELTERKSSDDPPEYKGKGHLIGLTVWDILLSLSDYDEFDLEWICRRNKRYYPTHI